MTVGDYKYYSDYRENLNNFYEENVKTMTISERIRTCKELEWLDRLLTVKKSA